jgi:cell division protein FtsI/penicillin-binding protein 2
VFYSDKLLKMTADRKITRVWLLFLGIIGFAIVIILRLYLIQIVYGDEFTAKASGQYFRPQPNIFERGAIFFSDKEENLIPAAVQKIGFAVSINPSSITNAENIYDELSSIIVLDKETFLAKFGKGGVHQEIASRLEFSEAESIKQLNLRGVNIYEEKWRHYPGDSVASHALGFMAYKEDQLAGRYGLERTYEKVLERENKSLYVNFFAEVFAGVKGTKSSKDSSAEEGDVVITIEPSVQAFLESELDKLNNKWNSEFSGAIVVDPKTGEIIALSAVPDFDLNNFQEENSTVFSNPLVENVFEMGSIVKALTMAAGLDAGAVRPGTTYFDSGVIFLDNYQISNFDGKGRGLVDMQSVLMNSLNTGAAFVANQMGNKKFAEYMFDFGLAERSGIDLPNEAAALIENLKSKRNVEYATASFGQGIAFAPTVMVRALTALANGGTIVTPHLLSRIDYLNGESKEFFDQNKRRVLKSQTAEEITRMLVKTVDEALLNGSVKIPNYSIAAKTGTAQIAKTEERGYYDDRFLHSFFGYFPAFEAKFLIFLFTYNPQGVRYASETLTHPFMDITKFLINYYDIPPDR